MTERRRADEGVRESEARHRTIVQIAMDGFWMVDMDGRLLDVNEAYCRMSGYTKQELLALRISDLDPAESKTDAIAHNAKIRAQGGDRFETRHRRKEGTLFDVEVSAQYLPGDGGRCVGFIRDISDRKRAEEALRVSEERYRALTEHAVTAVATHEIVLDATGRLWTMSS
jgi:PAS domain S-box-containing protein